MSAYDAIQSEAELPPEEPETRQQFLARWKNDIPTSMLSPAVMDLANEGESRDIHVPLMAAAGPAALALVLCGVLMVFFQTILFATTAAEAICDENGTVSYPMHLWNSFVLVALTAFAIELFSLRYSLIPFYHEAGQFEALGCRVNFKVWISVMLSLSLLNLLDLTTDSFFAATAIAADNCPRKKLDAIWRQVLDQSIFGALNVHVELQYLAFVFWLLTLSQIIVPLCRSLPSCSSVGGVTWEIADYPYSGAEFETFNGKKSNVGTLMHQMGEALGMATLSSQPIPFLVAAEKRIRKLTMSKCSDQLDRISSIVNNRLIFNYCFENVFQLNLQVTLLGITRAASGSAMTLGEMQAMGSIGISCVLTTLKLREVWNFFKIHRAIKDGIDERYSELSDENKASLTSVWWTVLSIRVWSLVMIGGMGYAMAKLVAVYYCEDSLLNVTGCVVLA